MAQCSLRIDKEAQTTEKTNTRVKSDQPALAQAKPEKKWHKLKLEDVSGKVMARPYIRFT